MRHFREDEAEFHRAPTDRPGLLSAWRHSDTAHRRPAVMVAACASAGAGLVHAAAAGTHEDVQSLVVLFSLCAIAQVGWAALAFRTIRPSKPVLAAGVLLNGAAVATWVVSRTAGLPLIDALREREAVGRPDLVAAVLAGVAVLGCAAAWLWPRTTSRVSPAVVAMLGVVAFAGAYVGVSAPHSHAGAGVAHAHDEADGAAHAHDEANTDTAAETTTESAPETGAADGGEHHHTLPDRLDHEPTAAQLADAEALVDDTKAALAEYTDVEVAVAAGYQSIGDGRGGYEHFVNAARTADPAVLDPDAPESLVYRIEGDGSKTLTTAMYILPPGSTMDDVPDVAGNLTVWHDHQNLCFAPGTQRLAGVLVDGTCRPGGELRPTAPMLHVWIEDNPCGPFAGVDGAQMTGSCEPVDF